jgi:hypothetical protein
MWDNTTSYDAIFVIVVSCAGVLVYQVFALWRRYGAASKWDCTDGQVIEGDGDRNRLYYVYTVEHLRFRGTRGTASDSFVIYREPDEKRHPGQKVKVHFCAKDPTLSLLRVVPAANIITQHTVAIVVSTMIATYMGFRVASIPVLLMLSAAIVFVAALSEIIRYKSMRSCRC